MAEMQPPQPVVPEVGPFRILIANETDEIPPSHTLPHTPDQRGA